MMDWFWTFITTEVSGDVVPLLAFAIFFIVGAVVLCMKDPPE